MKVNEIAGIGNHNTAKFWEYDTRIGRRWNMDPKPIIGISDYSAFTNNPIRHKDPNGDIIVFDKNASDDFKKNFGLSVIHLMKHGQIQELSKLMVSEKVYVIKESMGDYSQFKPDRKNDGGGVIEWNPYMGMRTNKDVKLSPTTILNHELDHAAKYDAVGMKNYEKNLYPDKGNPYRTKEEERVIKGSEQRTARALGEIGEGEVTREDHGVKRIIDTNSPTTVDGVEREPSKQLQEVIIKPVN